MSCCNGEREKGTISEYQKWDFITLSDFRAHSCKSPLSYAWLWFLALISVAVYAADTFTAINLLAFNRWSSQINPSIPFSTSKWIFAGCIIFSWVLCGYEWVRAFRVLHRGGVADSYLDPLAATLQSIRMGREGRGWRRFLVFAELTKSRKGADYAALFVYFQFKGAVRIVLAEGPRQAVNAITLYSVMQANLIPVGKHAAMHGHSAFVQFWYNLQILADQHVEESVILFTMLFTLCIWVVSALSLIIAVAIYIFFLWHYIPQADGRLSVYCRRKIDRRLEKIVSAKLRKVMEKDARRRNGDKLMKKYGEVLVTELRGPTLPIIADPEHDIVLAPLSRTTTHSTTPTFTRLPPPGAWEPSLPMLEDELPVPRSISRQASSSTLPRNDYESDASLLRGVAPLGYSGQVLGPSRPAFFLRDNESAQSRIHSPYDEDDGHTADLDPGSTHEASASYNFSRPGSRPVGTPPSYRRGPFIAPVIPVPTPNVIYELEAPHVSMRSYDQDLPRDATPYQNYPASLPRAEGLQNPSYALDSHQIKNEGKRPFPQSPQRAATQQERKVIHFSPPRRIATAPLHYGGFAAPPKTSYDDSIINMYADTQDLAACGFATST